MHCMSDFPNGCRYQPVWYECAKCHLTIECRWLVREQERSNSGRIAICANQHIAFVHVAIGKYGSHAVPILLETNEFVPRAHVFGSGAGERFQKERMEVGSVHVQSAKSVTTTNLVIKIFEQNGTGLVVAVVIDRTAARDSLKGLVYSQIV